VEVHQEAGVEQEITIIIDKTSTSTILKKAEWEEEMNQISKDLIIVEIIKIIKDPRHLIHMDQAVEVKAVSTKRRETIMTTKKVIMGKATIIITNLRDHPKVNHCQEELSLQISIISTTNMEVEMGVQEIIQVVVVVEEVKLTMMPFFMM
jgi:hypothetical protein